MACVYKYKYIILSISNVNMLPSFRICNFENIGCKYVLKLLKVRGRP